MSRSARSLEYDDNLDALNLRLRRQNDVLIRIAKIHIRSKESLIPAIREMDESSAYTLGSDRTSVWFYNDDRSLVRCIDLFERERCIHTQGKELEVAHFPEFFQMFDVERSVAVDNCRDDPRVGEFYRGYLAQLGIKSILNAAIWVDGVVVGVVCHSQVRFPRRWTLDERNFITSVANTIAHWVDIAGRKSAEDSLRGMQFSIDRAGDAILWVGPNAAICYANDATCRMLTYSREELLALRLFDIAPKLTPELWPEQWDLVKARGSITYESAHRTKKGEVIPVEVTLSYLQFHDQEYQCAFVRNITERKAAQSELENQRVYFRKVIDMNPNFIFAKDRAGRFVLVNQAVADAYGTTVQDLVGRTDADFNSNAEEVESFRRDDLEVIDGLIEKFVPEERITDAQGRVRYLQTVKLPLLGADGRAEQVLGVATDITDRKRFEEEQRCLVLQMQHAQKLESLGVLAGGIAHDFNNLLMGIIGNAALAEAELGSQPTVVRRISQITTAAKRAAELTNQLLAYSGRGKFVIESTDLTKLVSEMGALLDTIINKKACLTYRFGESVPNIDADPSQIRQVVMNLITNASDALGERGGKISVRTGIVNATPQVLAEMYLNDELPVGRYVLLEVSDTGCGMAEETVSRIFDPFFTTKFTGRGLGLAAVLGIVRSHRGALRVKSMVGRGTTFTVLFPVGESARASESSARAPESCTLRASGLFLVVDDEETSRSVTREILEYFGYEVLLANDGIQAVELFHRYSSELVGVLLDMTMPKMDGEETWCELTRIRKDIPVILTSGYSELEATSRFKGKKISGFIQKPFHPDQLKLKLNELFHVGH